MPKRPRAMKRAERLRDDWWHLSEDEVQTFSEVICPRSDELLAALTLVSVGILDVRVQEIPTSAAKPRKADRRC